MRSKHSAKYILSFALALLFSQCNNAESVGSVTDLPFALLMNSGSTAPFRIMVMQKDGSIIDLTEGIGPRWSPDGTRVAFWANTPGGLNEIFIMDSEGSNARNLTNSASSWETRPVWSPNGSMVAFDAEAIGSGKGLGIITSDGMERHFVPTGTPLTNSAWFPDGGSLLFHTVVGSRIQIHSVRSDGTGEMPLTSDTTVDFSGGKISPIGRRPAAHTTMRLLPYPPMGNGWHSLPTDLDPDSFT
jgi:hypothetical protein